MNDLRPQAGPLAGGVPTGARPPVWVLLTAAFLHPHRLLMMPPDRVMRALLVSALLSLACGAVAGAVQFPRILSRTTDWAKWMAGCIAEVQSEDGRLRWRTERALPCTGTHNGWRIDFVGAEQGKFDAERRLGPDRRGVWIAPEQVILWWRDTEQGGLTTRILVDKGLVFGFIKAEWLWPDGLSLHGEGEIVAAARQKVREGLPVFLISRGIEMLAVTMFYTFIFAFIPYVLRSPLAAGGFGRVYAFYLYVGVPCLVVATVYSSLGLPFLDFGACFVGSFILYLFLTVWRFGRAAGGTPRPA